MNEREALEFFASHGIDARRADPDVLNAAYRAIAKKLHPDQGGRPEAMKDLNRAYDVLKAAIKNGSFAREQERQAREQEARAQEAKRQAEKERQDRAERDRAEKERQEQAARDRAQTEREERERAEREPHMAEPRQQQVASTVTRVAKAAGWVAMMLVIIIIARLVGQESGRQSAERVNAERFLAEQAQAEQARVEQARAEQARAAQMRDEQARMEQARAEQIVAQQLAMAEAAAKSSDFTTAYSIWAPLAQRGNAVAQNHLGIMYYYGEGVQQDYSKAFEWQMKAAEQGNTAGMLDVGAAYSNGQGVAENDQVGHQWYLKAANKGNAQAQYNVGLNYKDGVGAPANLKEAKRYFLLAAHQDNYRAQLEVAKMGASDSPPDRTASIFWGAVAAINNLAEAQLFMGDLFLTGKLVPKDHQAAAMWFTLASGYTGKNIEYNNGEVGETASARLGQIKQVIGAEGLEKAKAAVKVCNNADSFTAAIEPCGLEALILTNPNGTFSVNPEVKADVVVPAAAPSPFESNLIEQLACQKRPNPTPILTHLMRNKYIRLEEMEGYDSVSCWKVVKPLSVRGLPVVGVCAYEEDDLVVSQNPGYYWRGPGTSPGVQITLVTSVNASAASSWWKETTEQIKVTPKIEDSWTFKGMTEVSCNESSRIWAEMQSRKRP